MLEKDYSSLTSLNSIDIIKMFVNKQYEDLYEILESNEYLPTNKHYNLIYDLFNMNFKNVITKHNILWTFS
jgi:hypothetical protein